MMDNVTLWKTYILNHIFYFKLKVTKVNLNQFTQTFPIVINDALQIPGKLPRLQY